VNKKALIVHIGICLVVGGLISYFTSTKWLAASFWVSAAMYINGAIAEVEDSLPGGFNNPDGNETTKIVKGWRATKFAITSLFITIVLVIIGYMLQEYL